MSTTHTGPDQRCKPIIVDESIESPELTAIQWKPNEVECAASESAYGVFAQQVSESVQQLGIARVTLFLTVIEPYQHFTMS